MLKKLAIASLMGGSLALQLPCGQLTQLSANDKDFIEYAGETDLVAARLGQMAQQRSPSEDVKKFGQMMEEEHTDNLKTLAAAANKAGGVAPDTLDDVHMNTVQRLNKAKGKSFDHQFLKAVVNQHENALVSFKREADHAFDQNLQAYAKETLPKLEEHLKQAKQLAASGK